MVILVSGASGFIGIRLVERLAADGYDVIALTRSGTIETLPSSLRIKWITVDIVRDDLDLEGLPEIDVVIHLAGATLGAGEAENLFLHANELTTVRLMEALVHRAKRFIYASSQVVYGDARHLKVTENFPTKPNGSAYAWSKLNSENWLHWFHERYGGQFLILRFCGFIDGGGLVDYLIEQALAGRDIELYSEGKVHRDYLPVNSAIDAIIGALKYSYSSEFLPINIGSGQAVTAHELAVTICNQLNSLSQIKLIEKMSPQGDFVFSIERAMHLLNFRPSNLIDSVIQYAKFRQENYKVHQL